MIDRVLNVGPKRGSRNCLQVLLCRWAVLSWKRHFVRAAKPERTMMLLVKKQALCHFVIRWCLGSRFFFLSTKTRTSLRNKNISFVGCAACIATLRRPHDFYGAQGLPRRCGVRKDLKHGRTRSAAA